MATSVNDAQLTSRRSVGAILFTPSLPALSSSTCLPEIGLMCGGFCTTDETYRARSPTLDEPKSRHRLRQYRPDQRQSTATARASQIACMRSSLSRPIRSVSMPKETLSTESRFTAVRRRTGSSPGSSTTSLASPRIVVVHGAMSARRRRGMATSRESTTTGRRPISGGSHHQSSPRRGRGVTTRLRRF